MSHIDLNVGDKGRKSYNLIPGEHFYGGKARSGREGFTGGIVGGIPNLLWNNRDAADYVNVVINRYGVPSSVDPTAGGIAIWKKDKLMNTPFDRIEVRDESLEHLYPMPHRDFVYTYVNYDLAPSKFFEVTSLTGSITYDAIKKQLRSRCGSMESNIATLALATQMGEGQISLNYAQQNDLYPQYILAATKDIEQYHRLYDLLAYTLKHQSGDPRSDGYWPLATAGTNSPAPMNLYNP